MRPFSAYSDVLADLLIVEVTLACKSSTQMAFVATTPALLCHVMATPTHSALVWRWRYNGKDGRGGPPCTLSTWPLHRSPLTENFAVWLGLPSTRLHPPLVPLPPRP